MKVRYKFRKDAIRAKEASARKRVEAREEERERGRKTKREQDGERERDQPSPLKRDKRAERERASFPRISSANTKTYHPLRPLHPPNLLSGGRSKESSAAVHKHIHTQTHTHARASLNHIY